MKPKTLVFNKKRCGGESSIQHSAEMVPTEVARHSIDGQDMVIVPVVMARGSVPMNGNLFPVEEMFPPAWNGVPVTIGHPRDEDGENISASSSPTVLRNWSVGRIFNVRVEEDKLKGEAWIEVEKLERLAPGVLEMLEQGDPIDVSTGLFCDTEDKTGQVAGRSYEGVYKNVNPDHLALLIGEEGACSFADGCGVRANAAGMVVAALEAEFRKFMEAIKMRLKLNKDKGPHTFGKEQKQDPNENKGKKAKDHERGDDNDPRQMIADLIASEDSPFVPDDEESLRAMSPDTLSRVAQKFGLGPKASKDDEEDEGEDPNSEANSGKGKKEANSEKEKANDGNKEKVNSEKEKANDGNKEKDGEQMSLSKEDKAALVHARRVYKEHREALINKVVANSDITKEAAQSLDTEVLETVANGIRPQPDYSGRALANADDGTEETVKMVPAGIVAHSQRQREETNKAN